MGLRRTDHAVSPVIGVLLMVAIAALMGAIIGVLVLKFGGDEQPQHRAVGMEVHSVGPGGRLDVVSISGGPLFWQDVSFGPTTTAECTLPEDGKITAGDQVLCSTEGRVTLIHDEGSDSVVIFEGEIR